MLKITQMDCAAPDETVVVVHWAYTMTAEDGRSAGFGGTTTVTRDPDAPFTPYADLTEEQVAGWVLAMWTPEYKASIEAILTEQLATPAPPLPWGATPAEPVVA